MVAAKSHRKQIIQYGLARTFGWASRNITAKRILTFHSVAVGTDPFAHQNPELFEQQIRYLAENRYMSYRISDIISRWPYILDEERWVALTFDDGVDNAITTVCPILQRYGMKATFFIPTLCIKEQRTLPEREMLSCYQNNHMISWHDLSVIVDSGHEIGSHGHSHVKLSRQSEEFVREDVTLSKKLLENNLMMSIKSFAYPFGRTDAFTHNTRKIISEAGYDSCCTMMSRSLARGDDLLLLPRTGITGLDTLKTFIMKLNGDYDCIRWIYDR